MPKDYKEFLKYYNGQSDPFALSFPPDQLVFLSTEDIVNLWTDINSLNVERFSDLFDTETKVRNVLYHPRRIPIAYNESSSSYLFLDYIPGPSGKEGQLVFNFNEIDCVVIEDSFFNFIQNYVRLLEGRKMVIKKKPSKYGQGYWFVSAQNELIDWDIYKRIKQE